MRNNRFYNVSPTHAETTAATAASYALTATTIQQQQKQQQVQILVKLDQCKTHCLNFLIPPTHDDLNHIPITYSQILTKLSNVTGIPYRMLKIHTQKPAQQSLSTTQTIFLSAYTFLPIRGGKGGFGTLLKGQSKKAGAKRTLDFGACRDLSGRRLRHVNDEIKLRKWRESMQKKMERSLQSNKDDSNDSSNMIGGIDIEEEIKQFQTMSGIRNWHLMVPNWSDVSAASTGNGNGPSKSKRKLERSLRMEVEKMARQKQEEYDKQMKLRHDREQSIMSYVNAGASVGDEKQLQEQMTTSIMEGLRKRKKRKLQDQSRDVRGQKNEISAETEKEYSQHEFDSNNDDSSFLALSAICTLSGDVIVEDDRGKKSSTSTLIQSKSEFATTAILLNASLFKKKIFDKLCSGLYYEVTIQTAGVSQIGWALLSVSKDGTIIPSTGKDGFLPNSDTGDGVGDDQFSYGFDGFRNLSFHNGQENKYGKDERWNNGDVIGCMYNYEGGSIQYSINGKNLGVAFDIKKCNKGAVNKQLLYPSFSLNENEIVGLNTGPTFQYCPNNYYGVGAFIDSSTDDNAKAEDISPITEMTSTDDNAPANKTKVDKTQSSETSSVTQVKRIETDMVQKTDNHETESKSIDLNNYDSPKELEAVGPDRLKHALFTLGCKCGGSLQERANRLFSTKGLRRDQFPKKIRGKNFQV